MLLWSMAIVVSGLLSGSLQRAWRGDDEARRG